jgi:hypothetical protein
MTEPTATTAASPAVWEDILEIFYAPSRVFARREGRGFGMPWLIYIVLLAVLFFATRSALQPVYEAEASRQIMAAVAKNPQINQDMIQQQMELGKKFTGVAIILFGAIGPLLVGLLLWLVGKAVGAAEVLATAMMVAVMSQFPRLLGFVAGAIQAVFIAPEDIRGQTSISLGPARFLDPDTASALTTGLLVRLDVFTIWATVLLAIGLKVTGKIDMTRAAIVAAIIWLLGALPVLLGALAQGG